MGVFTPFNFILMNNLDNVFDFEEYLIENDWKKRNNIWRKGLKSLYFTKGGLMIALNNKIGVKHKHIVTCETPIDFFEANVIFKKCRLNFNSLKNGTENKY
jgi:hypothetical protein